MLAAVFAALILQQAASQAVVWAETPPPPAEPAPAVAAPAIPDWARADPYAYERAECSPMIRKADESQDACQVRVRAALAANLGDALPEGLRAGGAAAEGCRQEAAGDRYALQCGAPSRPDRATTPLTERRCTTRPVVTGGAVAYREECTQDGREEQDGLRIRLGGND